MPFGLPDPLDELRAQVELVKCLPKPTVDRFKVSDLSVLEEHVERGEGPWRSLVPLVPPTFGIPIYVSEDVEPGYIEAWLGDKLVERMKLA